MCNKRTSHITKLHWCRPSAGISGDKVSAIKSLACTVQNGMLSLGAELLELTEIDGIAFQED